jgi:hypothetical protein
LWVDALARLTVVLTIAANVKIMAAMTRKSIQVSAILLRRRAMARGLLVMLSMIASQNVLQTNYEGTFAPIPDLSARTRSPVEAKLRNIRDGRRKGFGVAADERAERRRKFQLMWRFTAVTTETIQRLKNLEDRLQGACVRNFLDQQSSVRRFLKCVLCSAAC